MEDAEPINWEENGVARGIEVEIVNYLMAELNLQAEHHFYPWRRAQYHVRHGDLDAMIATPTQSRFEWAVFGKETVVPEYWNIFVPKNKPRLVAQINQFQKLEDMRPYSLVDFRGNGWSLAFMAEGYDIHYVPRLAQLPALFTQAVTICSSIAPPGSTGGPINRESLNKFRKLILTGPGPVFILF